MGEGPPKAMKSATEVATELSSRPERTRISYLTAAGNDHACGSP